MPRPPCCKVDAAGSISQFKAFLLSLSLVLRLEEQHTWASQQAASNSTAFWRAMRLVLAQLDGLMAGYAERAEHAERAQREGRKADLALPRLGLRDFLFMSAVGE
jgi:hypothetical protein